MDPAHLRIVVSGPVGSGKTTLARALAEHFGLRFLGEPMAALVRAETAFRGLRRTLGAPREQVAAALQACEAAYRACIAERAALYAMPGGFVADRWEVDLLDFWLVAVAPYGDDSPTADFLADMQRKARGFSAFVMLPLRRPASQTEGSNEHALRRNLKFGPSLLNWTVSLGLVRNFTDLPVVLAAEATGPIGSRVGEVAQLIESQVRP
jgi:hypothetical protein